MKIKPLITEKGLMRSKAGKYSFVVPVSYSAGMAKDVIEETFSVKVEKVWVLKQSGEMYFSRNRKRMDKSAKKIAVVSLKEGKIDIFESPESKSSKEEKVDKQKAGGKKNG